MELRHLRYFVAVAEELHFGRAARRLHLAQPPLSQQIRSLEEKLGVVLFHRTSRRVDLTAEGRLFLDHARLVLGQATRAVELVRAVGRGEGGRLTIGFVASALYAIVPDILRDFTRTYPQVEIRCFEMKPNRQSQALRQREIDVGFVRTFVNEHDLVSKLLVKESLVLALPVEHVRAGDSHVRIADLTQESFIFITRECAPTYYDTLMTICREAGFTPRIAQDAGEWQTVLALVAAGLGVAFVPASLRNWQRPGVAYLDLRPRTGDVPLNLVWRNEEPQPLVDAFVATAVSVAKRKPREIPALAVLA